VVGSRTLITEEPDMPQRTRFTILKVVLLTALVAGAGLAAPKAASGQSRGTLQVTATVVETQSGFAGLQAAHAAVIGFAATGQPVLSDVTTVAQVQVVPAVQTPGEVVVRIDYLKN
jgi:hypothetical protein